MITTDRRLRALHALLRRVEGDDVPRVQEAIRQRQHILEGERVEAEHPTTFWSQRPASKTRDDRATSP